MNIPSEELIYAFLEYLLEEQPMAIVFFAMALVIIFAIIIKTIRFSISWTNKAYNDVAKKPDKQSYEQTLSGLMYKELDKVDRKYLMKQALLLTMPVSLGIILILLLIIIDPMLLTQPRTFVGFGMFCLLGYVLCNQKEDWLLHQLLFSQCVITKEEIEDIRIRTRKELRIKKHPSRHQYYSPEIQYITTINHKDIPTLYRGENEGLKVGGMVYIIQLRNGKIFAL